MLKAIFKKYKEILAAVAGAAALAVLVLPSVYAETGAYKLVHWEDTASKNKAGVSICLPEDSLTEEASSLQLVFQLEGEAIEDTEFSFSSQMKKSEAYDSYYNKYDQLLTVVISGRKTILEPGKTVKIGSIEVESEEDVTISLAEEGCRVADIYLTEEVITDTGASGSYTMALSPEPETQEPETEAPPVSEPSRDYEYDSDEDEEIWDSQSEDTPGSWSVAADGSWSFLRPDGSPVKNEWVMAGGQWYHLNPEGKMDTGWIRPDQTWYYLSPSGAMKTGWVWDGTAWYHCASNGAMETGWIQDKTLWYYLSPSGSMKTGWVESNGRWYYMGEDGKMLTNVITPDGYILDRNGVWVP